MGATLPGWWTPDSLRGRFFGALLLIGLLPVLLLGTYSFFAERRRAVGQEVARLADHSQRLAVAIDKHLAASSTLIQHLAMSTEVISFLGEPEGPGHREAMAGWLRAHCAVGSDLDSILLVRPDGLCVASSDPRYLGANYAFRTYFQDAMAGRSRFTDLQIGLRVPDPFVGIARVVERRGEVLGLILLRIAMTRVLQQFVAGATEGRIVYLMNQDGIFLAHSRPDLVYSAIAPIPASRLAEIQATRQFMGREHPVIVKLNPESVQAVFRVSSTGRPEEFRYTNAGIPRWVALRRLAEEPWVVGVAVNEERVLTHSTRILLLTSLICLFCILLVVTGGLWFSWQVLRPMGRLQAAMEAFGQGEAQARAPEGGSGEVAVLGHQFNLMADTIVASAQALERRVDTLEGILPICASCRKIRNEQGVYVAMESFISERSGAQFSHGLCAECAARLYPDMFPPREG